MTLKCHPIHVIQVQVDQVDQEQGKRKQRKRKGKVMEPAQTLEYYVRPNHLE